MRASKMQVNIGHAWFLNYRLYGTDRSNSQYREGRTMWDPAEWENGPKGPPPPGGLLGLPRPFCDPFRRMLDCPALVSRLNMLMGASTYNP